MGLRSLGGMWDQLGQLASNPLGYVGESIGRGMGESPDEARNRLLQNEFRQVGPQLGQIGDQRGQLANQWLQGRGPQAQGAQAGQSGFRGDQSQLIGALQQQFAGQGPGQEIARRQAAMRAQSGIQNQLSQAAGQRGNPGAARLAAMNSANISGGAANAATMGGLQAQLQAGGLLSGTLQGARGQDLQRALSNAQMRQQNQQFNVGAQFQNRGQALQALQQQLLARQAEEQARTSRFGQIAGTATSNLPNQQTQGLGFLQGIAEAAMKG